MSNTTETTEDNTSAENRNSRDSDTRDLNVRKKAWQRPSILPTPNPKDGFSFRWVRLSMLNQQDVRNVHSRLREGWVPVTKKECPEVTLLVDESQKFKDNIVVGGLMLCKAPTEMVSERKEHFENMTKSQMHSVDNNFMANNDPRMPLFRERSSKTSFGRGD